MKLFEVANIQPFDRNDHSTLPSYLLNFFSNPEYFRREKNIDIATVMMSPDDYIREAEAMLTKSWGQETRSRMETGRELIEKYAKAMATGQTFPLPYLSYIDNLQDGLHRTEAAKLLGIKQIPVDVIRNAR